MIVLIRSLMRPYRRQLALVLGAMLAETLMSLASPWPLKVVLDNVIGAKRLSSGIGRALGSLPGGAGPLQMAVLAGIATVLMLLALLWLFVDLMVTRGRLPTFHELPPAAQRHFFQDWSGLDLRTRQELLTEVGRPNELAELTPGPSLPITSSQ